MIVSFFYEYCAFIGRLDARLNQKRGRRLSLFLSLSTLPLLEMFEGVASVRYEASGRGISCFVTIFELYKSDSISLRDAIDVYLTLAP